MKQRMLAIEPIRMKRKSPAPYIRLRGQWLLDLGFVPGKRVQITPTGSGMISLTVVDPSGDMKPKQTAINPE
jgi:hypothetical protein